MAKAQKLPSYYIPQVMWQLLCAVSAREAHYASYFPDDEAGEKLVVVPIRRDRRYLEWLFREALNFRLALIEDRPPASDAWLLAAKQYRAAKAEFDEAEARLKSYEATLLASMPEGSEVHFLPALGGG
jgi:predicted phage-related endonuclease